MHSDIDIGNILYIVITIVVVIVSLLGKKKKPAPGGVRSVGNSAGSGFMENLQRVLNMNEEPIFVEEEPYEEELVAEPSPPAEVATSNSTMRHRPSLIEEYSRIMHRDINGEMDLTELEGERVTDSIETEDLDFVSGTDYFEIIQDFDAGKAVVYSAIINRLDY
jgi:hypothetical protein